MEYGLLDGVGVSRCAHGRQRGDIEREELMYGTVGRLRIKAGQLAAFTDIIRELEGLPGVRAMAIVGRDDSTVDYCWTIVWDDQQAHDAVNARPEAAARYERLLSTLDGEPVWHSGEIGYRYAS
jgi:quinol monooxygenase YgiN